jgi:hypothetical protein
LRSFLGAHTSKIRNGLDRPKDSQRTQHRRAGRLAERRRFSDAALYFGREISVPIALAILLSFVLAPLVGILQRARIPRGFAVVSIVLLAFMIIFGLGP